MKKLILFLVIATAPYATSMAQEIISISDKDFNDRGFLALTKEKGWKFKQGGVPDISGLSLDTAGWISVNPHHITFKYADENGLVQGWCRFKFKVDSTLTGKDLYMNLLPSGAARVYFNGIEYDEAGYPDSDPAKDIPANGYLSRLESGWLPSPILLDTGMYTVEVYLTDHYRYFVDKYTFKRLTVGFALNLFPQKTLGKHIQLQTNYDLFRGIWLSGILLLTLLFGLLLLLNRGEKSLKWIALLTLALACSALIDSYLPDSILGINMMEFYDLFYYECIAIAIGLIPIAISQIIVRKVDRRLFILFGVLSAIYPIYWYFSGIPIVKGSYYYLMGAALLFITIVCVSILVKNKRKLKKAEWSLIWGIIVTITWMIIHTILINVGFGSDTYRLITVAMIYLSLPISFMIYIAVRYSENIFMLRRNLSEISELNQEKLRVQQEKQELIQSQKEVLERTVAQRTADLEESLNHLKATQAQLIHAEKMASLGELTAGIAHEIQNPLNFVNNFSEVSVDLLEELHEDLLNKEYAEVDAIAGDLKQNLEKISHHGKRASGIVKSMLEHSRSGSGEKVPANLNALAEEYLRLAYHGLRAKDKSFNANFRLEADENLPDVTVVPQDIGRVLLNLINNAFYAVSEKAKQNIPGYQPEVVVTTKNHPPFRGDRVVSGGRVGSMNEGGVEIRVSDNGNGIPDEIREKIFQPFFTTKPTGEGTGLGLSMSYDIITKGHGGSLGVESKAGEGTTFGIVIPNDLTK